MSREKQIDIIRDLLVEFDEMGFVPSTTVPDPEAYAIKWRAEITKALEDYFKQSEGEWHYNPDGMDWGLGAWQCSLCGCRNDNLPMDKNIKPLRWAGSKYCPNCGSKMKGGN